MARYIDADKLLEYIGTTERCGDCSYYENDIECRSHSLSRQDICNIVEDLVEESTDVQPVVRGEWIPIGEPDKDNNQQVECSNCHAGDLHAVGVEVPYCWKCGARMVKE